MSYYAFSWPTMVVAALAVIVIGLLIAWSVAFLERRNRGEQRAEQIQHAVGHALARDSSLRDASILPVASFPVEGHPTLELTGYVPSADARRHAVQVAERELGRVRPGMRVVDRLDVFRRA